MLTRFVTADLREPLQPIYVDERYDQLDILVLWGYLPLGHLCLQCPVAPRTFDVPQLKNILVRDFAWQLWQNKTARTLDQLDEADSLPPISVVVCTRDRPILLQRCLQALAELDYPDYEVIVVDNHSRDPSVADVVAQNKFRYVREDTPGLDWARNRGVKEARHEIIAFIDDDALASRGWLRGLARGFEDKQVMAVTGLVLPTEIETQVQQDFETYGGMGKGFSRFTVRRDELSDKQLFWASNWGVGANMAFRRALFETIGDFDVALDVGTPTNGGGDIEFFYRTVAAGHTLQYEPAAWIRHLHRRDALALDQQVRNNGRSFPAFLLTIARNEPHKRLAVLRFALYSWLWHWLLWRLFKSLLRRDRLAVRLALKELGGSFSALSAYRKSQHLAQRHSASLKDLELSHNAGN